MKIKLFGYTLWFKYGKGWMNLMRQLAKKSSAVEKAVGKTFTHYDWNGLDCHAINTKRWRIVFIKKGGSK